MGRLLNQIKEPNDIKRISPKLYPVLAEEIRDFLLNVSNFFFALEINKKFCKTYNALNLMQKATTVLMSPLRKPKGVLNLLWILPRKVIMPAEQQFMI